MKKAFFCAIASMIVTLFAVTASLGGTVYAAGNQSGGSPSYSGIQCSGAASASPVCSAGTSDPLTGGNGLIVKVTRLVALVAGFTAVAIIIVAGILFITSGGDSSKTTRAREAIIYASVGLVVIVIAQAIVTFIVSKA